MMSQHGRQTSKVPEGFHCSRSTTFFAGTLALAEPHNSLAMAAANAPIAMREALTLPSVGINPQFITFTHVTMESNNYICVRETSLANNIVIIDMSMPMHPLRRPITADSALMNPNSRILALKDPILLLNSSVNL